MTQEHILLTGVTGSFGRYLAKDLINRGCDLTFLVRAKNDKEARSRAENSINAGLSHVKVLAADLATPDLALPMSTYTVLARNVTGILHSAASTRFDLSLDQARLSNVKTTKNLLRLAGRAKNLSKLGYLSSAFVAGRKTGLIPEAEIDSNLGFVNTYDQTKYEAEAFVRTKLPELPIVIYRPSLVVAPDSSDHHAAIFVLKLIQKKLLPVLPGQATDAIDLISAVEAADVIARLFGDYFKASLTYNVVSGKLAPKLQDIVAITGSENEIQYCGGAAQYDQAVKQLTSEYPLLKPIYDKVDCFIKYLAFPKLFDNSLTQEVLGKTLGSDSTIEILRERLLHE